MYNSWYRQCLLQDKSLGTSVKQVAVVCIEQVFVVKKSK